MNASEAESCHVVDCGSGVDVSLEFGYRKKGRRKEGRKGGRTEGSGDVLKYTTKLLIHECYCDHGLSGFGIELQPFKFSVLVKCNIDIISSWNAA